MNAKPYYERHIFFCTNQREDEAACQDHRALEAFSHCKERARQMDLLGEGKVRVNKAGCLDRCAAGPVAVVYPEGTWYTYVDLADIDEIVEQHLHQGQVVERLRIPAHVGR